MFKRNPVPFRSRYRTSREIFGQAWHLVRGERDLWRFPILSGTIFILMMVAIGALVPLAGFLFDIDLSSGLTAVVLIPAAIVLSIPVMFLASLLNAAYAFGLYERMDGREVSAADAWARARAHSGTIFRFTLLAALVAGVLGIIGQLLDRLRIIPYVGQAMQAVGTFAWAVAAFFVIPLIVVERERSAFGALRTSVSMARDTWGRSTAGMVTIGLALMVPMFIFMFVLFAAAFPLLFFAMAGGASVQIVFPIFIGLMVVMLLGVAVLGMAGQAANTAYQVALFRTTRTGNVPLPFTPETLVDAWAPYRQ